MEISAYWGEILINSLKKKAKMNGNFRLLGEIFISTKINKQKYRKKK